MINYYKYILEDFNYENCRLFFKPILHILAVIIILLTIVFIPIVVVGIIFALLFDKITMWMYKIDISKIFYKKDIDN